MIQFKTLTQIIKIEQSCFYFVVVCHSSIVCCSIHSLPSSPPPLTFSSTLFTINLLFFFLYCICHPIICVGCKLPLLTTHLFSVKSVVGISLVVVLTCGFDGYGKLPNLRLSSIHQLTRCLLSRGKQDVNFQVISQINFCFCEFLLTKRPLTLA